MNMKYTNCLLASVLAIGLSACGGKNNSAAQEKAAQLLHNLKECPNPKVDDGYYDAKVATDDPAHDKYIEIENELDQNGKPTGIVKVNLYGKEYIPVNGKDTPQKNGTRLTGSCIKNDIELVGKDKDKNLIKIVLKRNADGSLNVDQQAPPPKKVITYTKAGPLSGPIDAIRDTVLDPSGAQEKGSGVPDSGSVATQPNPMANPAQQGEQKPAPAAAPAKPAAPAPQAKPAPAAQPVQQK